MDVAIKPSNQRGRPQQERATSEGPTAIRKGAIAVIYGEPETPRFLAALQRLKRQQRKKERQTRLAKQRVRTALRKMREC
jgi:hypothetical protein